MMRSLRSRIQLNGFLEQFGSPGSIAFADSHVTESSIAARFLRCQDDESLKGLFCPVNRSNTQERLTQTIKPRGKIRKPDRQY